MKRFPGGLRGALQHHATWTLPLYDTTTRGEEEAEGGREGGEGGGASGGDGAAGQEMG